MGQAAGVQSDRRVHQGVPLSPLGQRARVHCQGHREMAQRERDQDPIHRPRMPMAERVRRELQYPILGGMPGPGADIHAQRVASGFLGLEGLLQQAGPAQIPRLANPKRVCHRANKSSFPLRSPYGLPPPEGAKQQHQPRKPSREFLIRTGLNSGI